MRSSYPKAYWRQLRATSSCMGDDFIDFSRIDLVDESDALHRQVKPFVGDDVEHGLPFEDVAVSVGQNNDLRLVAEGYMPRIETRSYVPPRPPVPVVLHLVGVRAGHAYPLVTQAGS